MFEKQNQQIHFLFCAATGAFSCGVPIFVWMLINVIEVGANIQGVLIFFVGAHYPDFPVLQLAYRNEKYVAISFVFTPDLFYADCSVEKLLQFVCICDLIKLA